ncbi:MAG: CBS domain-containing protein [Burkholderiales bacterium]|nr:CBS domain-containing protein [Burkholderiales bacterium]
MPALARDFQPLPIRELGEGAGYRRPMQPVAARVTLESPALAVMTDLARTSPATIRLQAPIEGANQYMISRGVRLLLVVDERDNVVGVVTATDILGERALRVASERGLRRDDLTVGDIMTPAREVEVLEFREVERARVGHVLETLRRAGRQHALVVDEDTPPAAGPLAPAARRAMVCGIFSMSQIARQLGVAVEPGAPVARTFAEIESALVHRDGPPYGR